MGYGIDPKIDFAFHKVYASEGNEPLLVSLGNCIFAQNLAYPIESLHVLNPYILPKSPEDKQPIFDIRARDQDGRSVCIEMQQFVRKVHRKRSAFYLSSDYCSQLHRGDESYQLLKEVYHGHILVSNLFHEDSQFHKRFSLREDDYPHALLTPDLSLHFLQLRQFQKTVDQLTSPLDRWAYFLKHGKDLDLETLPPTLHDPLIIQALETLESMSTNIVERTIYEDRLKATRDYNSNMIDVRETAEARGKRRGKREGKLAGIREGELKARLESIEFGLKVRFGDAGLALMPRIKTIKKLATIQLLWDGIIAQQSLSELESLIPK